MTLAPRSWPSRPGLAMTTRSFRMSLDNRPFLVLPPHVAERVAHLADGRVRTNRFKNMRHDVLGRACGRAQAIEASTDAIRVASLPHLLQFPELCFAGPFVDVQNLDRRLVLLHVFVDT